MITLNYIHDTERRYNAALIDGCVDTDTKQLYLAFCKAKKEFETASGELNAFRLTTRCDQQESNTEEIQLRRRCNGAECELSVLNRRISLNILHNRRKFGTMAA